MTLGRILFSFCACAILGGVTPAQTTPPGELSYQGVLRDAGGAPLSGAYDMTFRFFTSASGGSELLVDRHTVADSAPVTVDGGLFRVALGTGAVADGSGPGTLTTLAALFSAHAAVWMRIEVAGEVLSPRVKVVSTPYALNAGSLQGIAPTSFLRNDVSGEFTGGTLELGPGTTLLAQGSPASMTISGTNLDLEIDGGVTAYSLDLVDNLTAERGFLRQDLYLNYAGPDFSSRIFFYDGGQLLGQSIAWNDSSDRFTMSNDLGVSGSVNTTQLNSSGNVHVRINGPDGNGSLWFYEAGSEFGERVYWNDGGDRFEVSDDLWVTGQLDVTGSKNFVQNHPEDPTKTVVFTALEGDEAATFTRGTARLAGGEVRIDLPEAFAWVTHPGVGLTAHLTPRSGPASLWVASVTPAELVVRGDGDARFDYVVLGLRIGYAESPVVRERTGDAPVPSAAAWDRYHAAHPGGRETSPLARHTAMAERVGLAIPAGDDAAELRAAIGTSAAEPGSAPERTAPREETVPPPANPDPAPVVLDPRAEWLVVTGDVVEGDVLALDPEHPGALRRASSIADPGVIGVAVGPAVREAERNVAPIVAAGTATVRVDAGYGAIAPGDLLVASATAGHAMRALEFVPGTVLGKAMEALDAGVGTIRVLLMQR